MSRILRSRPLHALMAVLVLAGCDNSTATAPQALSLSALAAASGQGQTAEAGATLSDEIAVLATDASGRAVQGAEVSWSIQSGGGTLTLSQTTTDWTGQATAFWTLGPGAGAQTLLATVTAGGTVLTKLFTATAVAGPVANIVVVSGAGQSATAGSALPAPIVVKVTDAFGNPVAGATVTWAAATGTLAAVTSLTDANGMATNALTLGGTVGAAPVTVTVDGPSGPVETTVPEAAT